MKHFGKKIRPSLLGLTLLSGLQIGGGGLPAFAAVPVNTAEVHWRICPRTKTELIQKMGLKQNNFQARDVWYLDTPLMDLYNSGVLIRGRQEVSGKEIEKLGRPDVTITLKIKGLEASQVSAEWLDQKGFKCESDFFGNTEVRSSCSLNATLKSKEWESVLSGSSQVETALSGLQIDFLKEYAAQFPGWSGVKAWGAVTTEILDLPQKKDLELGQLGADLSWIEVSQKTPLDQSAHSQAALKSWLEEIKLPLCLDQGSKTHLVLKGLISKAGKAGKGDKVDKGQTSPKGEEIQNEGSSNDFSGKKCRGAFGGAFESDTGCP